VVKSYGQCHYCSEEATTRDHIVPESRTWHYSGIPVGNTVGSCWLCNQHKADYRSDCECSRCTNAWATYGPPGWMDVPVVQIVDWKAEKERQYVITRLARGGER
jgi:hypothetical protein